MLAFKSYYSKQYPPPPPPPIYFILEPKSVFIDSVQVMLLTIDPLTLFYLKKYSRDQNQIIMTYVVRGTRT